LFLEISDGEISGKISSTRWDNSTKDFCALPTVASKDQVSLGGFMEKYKCLVCGYIYDPAVGDPDGGIVAGTAFKNIGDDWVCPECGVGKDQFEKIEE